jgi:H+/Cl- antiporter ClcA
MKHKTSYNINQRFTEANTKNFKLLFYALIIGLIVGLVGAFFRITFLLDYQKKKQRVKRNKRLY